MLAKPHQGAARDRFCYSSLQAQQCYRYPYPIPLEDDGPVQRPTEESGRSKPTDVTTEVEGALKYPTPVSEAQLLLGRFDFFVADWTPDLFWSYLMKELRASEEKWAHDGFDDYIQLCQDLLTCICSCTEVLTSG